MKKFQTESQRVLDLMIHSIYTHKEIFLRELLSNASDAIDKLYYRSLTDQISGLAREDFRIRVLPDKEARTLTITDNGVGMTEEELENNLGVIAKSGSLAFKKEMEQKEDVNIIGQFGVGFYSAFMVADKVEVRSRAYGSEQGHRWYSESSEGYEIAPCDMADHGTEITLYLKADGEESYSEFLEDYTLRELIKRYSDYIRYPIQLPEVKPDDEEKDGETKAADIAPTYETVNSMVPLWKRNKNEIKKEDYDGFYTEKFFDYNPPLRAIHVSAEGAADYKALLFIPSKAPYNYYSKQYEKGLQLYTDGVMIMEKCADLIPDCFSFVRGVVDSQLTLNISRETIQHNRQLKLIATGLEKKIKTELTKLLENEREEYEKFFGEFGLQLKYGIYDNWGANKDLLKDLVLFRSLNANKFVTLKEYVSGMKEDQKYIFYATGKSTEAIANLPQVEGISAKGYDVLCLTEDIDEFAIKFLGDYDKKEFKSAAGSDLGLPEEEILDTELTDFIKDALDDKVTKVKATTRLKNHAVCFTTEGEVSIEMEKVLNSMPGAQKGVKAQKVLELNANHPLYQTLKSLRAENPDRLKQIASVLFAEAQLIEGIVPENPTELSDVISNLLV